MNIVQELELKSIEYRKSILAMIVEAKAGHTGGSLSCIDILNVLYNQTMNISPERFNDPDRARDRDRYIQSKGHSVEALYAVLADRGFYPASELSTLNKAGSHFVGHPTRKIPGIEHNSGGLGHGLSVAVGVALAGKLDKRDYRVFTLLGDGELAEGSSWEAAMTAAHYDLDNLVVIVDRNGLQITGTTEEVNGLEPLVDKFVAFGFAVRSVDGNDIAALVDILDQPPFEAGKPSLILSHTVKGKGVSFIENAVNWHHHVPTEQEYEIAMAELDAAAAKLVEEPQWN